MYLCKSRYLTRGEVWFDNEPGDTRSVDLILYQQRSRAVPGARWRYFYTYVIDLTQSVEQLRTRLHHDTAYKVRRARDRDKIICESCDANDPAVLDQFEEMYNQFARAKGLPRLDRGRIESMMAAGVLDLSVAKNRQGNSLVYHANYRDHRRARELYLPSLYRQLSDSTVRNLIGRANRYLIWSNMLRYKDEGLKCYDFGGWYPGSSDQTLLKINEFKRGFGGEVLREYECEQILTLKGWLVLNVARLLKQAKLFPSRSKKVASGSAATEVQDAIAVPSA
jgi:hypothetical protein